MEYLKRQYDVTSNRNLIQRIWSASSLRPLPYLFICAFIANAASFVLPISNPANLVIYDADAEHWLAQYGLPSVVSIGITYAVLRFTQQPVCRER